MSRVVLAFVVGLTEAWVRLYTAGLSSTLRDARRSELASDLWEHQHTAYILRQGAAGTAFQVLSRTLLGVPADISWRVAAGRKRRIERGTEGRVRMNPSRAQKGFVGIALLMVALYVALGISNAVINQEPTFVDRFGEFWGGVLGSLIGFIPAALIVTGLWQLRRSPVLGGALVLIGAVPVALAFYWTIFGPVLALLLVIFWIYLLRRRSREDGSVVI